MKRQVAYLMSGEAHLPYLVCSLWTLRKHWDGDVVIHAWPESFDKVDEIAKDDRLRITTIHKREPAVRKHKSTQSLDKMRVVQSMKGRADVVMYIDADTTIHKPIDDLFEWGHKFSFAATQFCDWVSTGSKISHRIRKLRDYPEIDQKLVEQLLVEKWPSVNSGIFAARPDSPVFNIYYDWTLAAKGVFIADEVVLHTMQPLFHPSNQMVTIKGGAWNCSAMYQPKSLKDEDVIIYHYHGDSNVKPKTKSQRGFDLWWPIYQECLKENIGRIQDWRWSIKNKFMNPLERELIDSGEEANWC